MPSSGSARPLAGVHVLDLTRLLPGAYATLLMADLGADVVKIEDPRGGDPARTMPPIVGGAGVYFRLLNRNKRSVTLDLRSPDAASVLDALVRRFDVVVESFRPKTSKRLGVDAATLRGRHPRLIYASISGFGQSGPYADRAAHDINYEALSGMLSATRNDGQAPDVPRTLIADIGAAMYAASGILAALFQRERTGEGATVDVAIHEAALSWLTFPAAQRLVGASPEGPRELPIYGHDACYNIYLTRDDRYLALGALEPKFWTGFCERAGRADLASLQDAHGDERARVLAEVRALMRTRTRDEWLALFADTDVCLTPVNTVEEALADPHLATRGALTSDGASTYITTPIVMSRDADASTVSRAREMPVTPPPALGVHTDAELDAAGIGQARRADLRSRGII